MFYQVVVSRFFLYYTIHLILTPLSPTGLKMLQIQNWVWSKCSDLCRLFTY